ncbi:unnamed protein product [Heterosigma akashiwo]
MAYYNLGNTHHEMGENKEAIKYFVKAIELNPNHEDALFNLGVVYQEEDNSEKAIECYEAAFQINPDLTEAQQHARMLRDYLDSLSSNS